MKQHTNGSVEFKHRLLLHFCKSLTLTTQYCDGQADALQSLSKYYEMFDMKLFWSMLSIVTQPDQVQTVTKDSDFSNQTARKCHLYILYYLHFMSKCCEIRSRAPKVLSLFNAFIAQRFSMSNLFWVSEALIGGIQSKPNTITPCMCISLHDSAIYLIL